MGDPGASASSSRFEHRSVAAGPLPRDCTAGIVVARFNGAITGPLFAGAVDALLDAGIEPGRIAAVEVPGCIEVPLAAQALARRESCELVVALGCVIRGESAHFDYVCSFVTDGCRQVMLGEHVPLGFGILTCDDAAQAQARASSEPGGRNVGRDAAEAAVAMRDMLSGPRQGGGIGFA